jgi:hypothetical protein
MRGAAVLAFVVAASVAALVSTTAADGRTLADPPAQLLVVPFNTTPGAAGAETEVELSLPASSALAVQAVTVYVPADYAVAVGSPPGTAIGEATLKLAGSSEPATANVITVDPTPLATDPAAQACAPGPHVAAWSAVFALSGQSFPLTIFADPTSGEELARGSYKLVYCLPSPSIPVDQGGMPAGARVVDVDLDLRGVFTNPPAGGQLLWRAIVIPYAAGTGTAAPDQAFEVRSLVFLPQVLTAKASYNVKKGAVVVNGKLIAAHAPRGAVKVHIVVGAHADLSDARELGTAQTKRNGTFSLVKKVARKKAVQRLTLVAYVNPYDAGCGQPAALAVGGCLDETIAPAPPVVGTVTIPKLPRKK